MRLWHLKDLRSGFWGESLSCIREGRMFNLLISSGLHPEASTRFS